MFSSDYGSHKILSDKYGLTRAVIDATVFCLVERGSSIHSASPCVSVCVYMGRARHRLWEVGSSVAGGVKSMTYRIDAWRF